MRFVGNAWAGPATVALKGGPRIKCNQLIIETCPWCPTLQSSLQVIASNEYSQQLVKERQQLKEDRDRTRDKLADTRLEVAALCAQLAQLSVNNPGARGPQALHGGWAGRLHPHATPTACARALQGGRLLKRNVSFASCSSSPSSCDSE